MKLFGLVCFILLLASPVWAQCDPDCFSPFKVGTAEIDEGGCWVNDTEHFSDNTVNTVPAPVSTRVEGFCAGTGNEFTIHDFGFTSGDIPTDATINFITVRIEFHGGAANQSARRRIDLWVIFSDGTACGGATPGRDNAQLAKDIESNPTWNEDDSADGLWGCTWSPSDIFDSDFGVKFNHTSDAGLNVVGLDFLDVRVNYTPASTRSRMMILSGD